MGPWVVEVRRLALPLYVTGRPASPSLPLALALALADSGSAPLLRCHAATVPLGSHSASGSGSVVLTLRHSASGSLAVAFNCHLLPTSVRLPSPLRESARPESGPRHNAAARDTAYIAIIKVEKMYRPRLPVWYSIGLFGT